MSGVVYWFILFDLVSHQQFVSEPGELVSCVGNVTCCRSRGSVLFLLCGESSEMWRTSSATFLCFFTVSEDRNFKVSCI